MPTLSVGNDIVFHYTDSGPIENTEYSTLVFVHGLSFHTGTFKRILPLASSHSLRVICLSRRGYEGSTSYSENELKTLHHGSDAERANFLHNEGILIALFIDGLIQSLSLPKKGGVVVGGWSLGNLFTIAMRASINDLPDDTKQRLKEYTRGFIVFDAPNEILGYKRPEGVLQMKDIPEKDRAAFFFKWVSTYYKHGDLSSRDFSQLEQLEGDASRKPTTETMSPEELQTIIDFGPAVKFEMVFIESQSLLPTYLKQTREALFDPHIREAWGGQLVSFVYCEDSIWVVHYAAWNLEKEVKASEVNIKSIPGANHFPMWDAPDKFLSIMKECFSA